MSAVLASQKFGEGKTGYIGLKVDMGHDIGIYFKIDHEDENETKAFIGANPINAAIDEVRGLT